MSNETIIAYWSGEEPTTGPKACPTLDQTPDYVDVVILFYATITDGGDLNFDRLILHNSQATIMGWMNAIRDRQRHQARKTKFTLGILGGGFPDQDPAAFSAKVAEAARDWGVDGITVDYEPPNASPSIVSVVQAIREALPPGSIMTAPIYAAWLGDPQLKPFAAVFDYINTMDYTPYPDYENTVSWYEQYAATIGSTSEPAYNKLGIGVSCMVFSDGNHTPLEDVIRLCRYEPASGKKLGIMLYTLSYDSPGHGSPYPLFKYAESIHENLP